MLVKRWHRNHPHLPATARQVFPHILRHQDEPPSRVNVMSSSKAMMTGYRLLSLRRTLKHYRRTQCC